MRIAYIVHARFPTEKAYGHQVAQVCAALQTNGHEVELVCPDVAGALLGNLRDLYRVDTDLRVTKLPVFDALRSPFVPGFLAVHVTWFSYRKALRAWFAEHRPDLAYARAATVLAPALDAGIPSILELHTVPGFGQPFFRSIAKRCAKIVALTTPMRDALLKRGLPAETIIVEPDGIDLASFERLPDTAAAKTRWKLPEDVPVVAYVGSLRSGHDLPKGVEELVEAAALLRKQDEKLFLWIVGGPKDAEQKLRTLARDRGLGDDAVRFEGSVPSSDVPVAIAAADVCVYPAPGIRNAFFLRDTSPLKLLEYMAAGKPTVTADLPPVHDLLDDTQTRFCAAGDPADLAAAVHDVLANLPAAYARAKKARAAVERFEWKERMKRIVGR